MKDFDIKISVREMALAELDPKRLELANLAIDATERSYAPYSRFRVGAAIRLSDGAVVTGSNQENVAYPSGTCAERTACYYAHSSHPDAKFEAIAIAARDTDGSLCESPIPPCGACRQALLEYETLAGRPVEVMLVGRDKAYVVGSVRDLLPFAFSEFK